MTLLQSPLPGSGLEMARVPSQGCLGVCILLFVLSCLWGVCGPTSCSLRMIEERTT